MGIIHSNMRLVDACLGSAEGMVVIFCTRKVVRATSTGRIGVGSGAPRSSPRNVLSSGISWFTLGSHGYSLPDRSMSASGVEGSIARRVWNSPMKMGNWSTIGPRQPMGFTPCSRYSRSVSWDRRCLSLEYRC